MPFLFELLQPSAGSGCRPWLTCWLLGALLLLLLPGLTFARPSPAPGGRPTR